MSDASNARERAIKRLRTAHADREARRATFDAGDAAPWVYEAQAVAVAVAEAGGDDLSDDERDYMGLLLCDEAAKLEREGSTPDAMEIGRHIGRKARRTIEVTREGGALSVFRGGAFSSPAAFARVRQDLEAARRPVVKADQPRTLDLSPISEWRRATDQRVERQTVALERLLAITEQDSNAGRSMLPLTWISAVAAVVAAVAAIIAL